MSFCLSNLSTLEAETRRVCFFLQCGFYEKRLANCDKLLYPEFTPPLFGCTKNEAFHLKTG